MQRFAGEWWRNEELAWPWDPVAHSLHPLSAWGGHPGGTGEQRANPRRVGVPCSLLVGSCKPRCHPGVACGGAKPHFWGPRRTDSAQHSRKAKIPPRKHRYPKAKDRGIPLKPTGSGSAVQVPDGGPCFPAQPFTPSSPRLSFCRDAHAQNPTHTLHGALAGMHANDEGAVLKIPPH